MSTITLAVEGMTCEHCETTIEAALSAVGARDPKADFRRGVAVFGFDGDPAPAVEAVCAAGYRPGTPSHQAQTGVSRPSRSGCGGSGHVDLVMIGSGSAAFAAAIRARSLGATVAMVEAATVGGTC